MSFHAGQSFTFGETPSATKWNYLWENDYALQDWTAFTNATFPVALLSAGSVTAAKLDSNAVGHGFLEIGRTTIGTPGTSISVGSLPAYKYLRVYMYVIPSGGAISPLLRLNGDSGSNYSHRYEVNGGADTSSVSQSSIPPMVGGISVPQIGVLDMINVSAQEKLITGVPSLYSTAGAGNTVNKFLVVGKWANTSAQISTVALSTATNNFGAGSEIIVFGKN